jgi:phosphoribosylformimino-5-aminoimidazole carboxamide ribotide isomerase
MRIIVALDIIGGKCVRLTRGDFDTKKIYSEDPLAVAREVEESGIEFLHLVDLDGAKNKKIENLKVLEKIASQTTLKIDFGGGVRTDEDLKMVFDAGAVQVTAGSIAASDPGLFMKWLSVYGPDRLILGADYKDRKIAAGGWLENSGMELISFLKDYREKGVSYTICTDIDRDGMLQGPAVELYSEILENMDINLIASGGVSSLEDIDAIRKAGCEGVIVGKAFYEGKITLKELGRQC